MMVMMAVVMMTRHVDTRHIVMTVVMMVARPRMIVAMVTAVLNVRDDAGRPLLDGGGDAWGERGCRLRLRRRRRDNQQSADGEQAEKFSDEHQYSPSGVR